MHVEVNIIRAIVRASDPQDEANPNQNRSFATNPSNANTNHTMKSLLILGIVSVLQCTTNIFINAFTTPSLVTKNTRIYTKLSLSSKKNKQNP